MRKRIYCLFCFLSGLFLISCAPSFDTVIVNGVIIDGTGTQGYQADIGIRNGAIAAIGKLQESKGRKVINAKGKYITPGFIDIHTHSDRGVIKTSQNKALNYLTQGVTTLVGGNCGNGTYDVADYFQTLEKQGVGTNIVHLVGHATVRREVMQDADRDPTEEEMKKMKSLVERAMREGAAGLSTGLFYAPGSFAETEEIIELCSVVREYGGFYASHIRDESDYTVGLKAAIKEAVEIGEKSGIPVQIAHIKTLGKPVWGQAGEVCQIIEDAQTRGVTVYADQYPYRASSTGLISAIVPRWVQADGKLRERLADPELLPKITAEIAENIQRRGGAETLIISSFSEKPDWEGKSLKEISDILDKSAADSAISLALMGDPGIVSFNMTEKDVE
ncbi:amidohydrolase family protein, partial [Acidobacteriota bacterium]